MPATGAWQANQQKKIVTVKIIVLNNPNVSNGNQDLTRVISCLSNVIEKSSHVCMVSMWLAAISGEDSSRLLEQLYLFLMAVCRAFPANTPQMPDSIARALLIIETEFCHEWLNMEALALAAGLTRAHFSFGFSRYVGKSPHAVLTERRMREALE